MVKTQEEIVQYYRQYQYDDFLHFTGDVLVRFLTVEQAAEFLRTDTDFSKWQPKELTETNIISQMRDYMEFAWGKVESHRAISAGRSVEKMKAWLWLLGDEEMWNFADNRNNYPQYGAPILKAICEKYGFEMPADGWWFENMTTGKPCHPRCDNGCGK